MTVSTWILATYSVLSVVGASLSEPTLRSRCVWRKYSPRVAKEIVRNEADTPISPPGKDTQASEEGILPINLPPR